MNNRIRQQMHALEKLRTVEPILATLTDEQNPRQHGIVFIHPDDWEETKRMYGDRLNKVLE